MNRAKQKSIRVFEIYIENRENFLAYIEKNFILLKEYLLILGGEFDDELKSFLDSKGLIFSHFEDVKFDRIDKKGQKSSTSLNVLDVENRDLNGNGLDGHSKEAEKKESLIIEKTIRSGEEIEHSGDIIIFGRVNSGSRVVGEGNISIFARVDGVVECYGDMIIVENIGSGHLVFKGEILDNALIPKKRCRIFLDREKIVMEEF